MNVQFDLNTVTGTSRFLLQPEDVCRMEKLKQIQIHSVLDRGYKEMSSILADQ